MMDLDEHSRLLESGVSKDVVDIEIAEAVQKYIPDTDEEKKLLRKIDLRLIPILWLMYILNFVDRTNIGNAKIAGMSEDLHLDDSRYAWALSVFFVGYLCMEVPSNMLLSRSRPSIFLPGIMLVWGALSVAMARTKSYSTLLAFRFTLGCIEAGFFPGVLYVLSCWYKPAELGKRFAMFFSASVLAGAFGGLLAGSITQNLAGAYGIAAWRWLFIVEGLATVCVAIIARFILLDFPSTSPALSAEERQLATIRLLAAGVEPSSHDAGNRLSHWQAFVATASDYRTFLFMFLCMCMVGAATITYFVPTITVSMGYETVTAQYMTIPVYIITAIFLNITAVSADHFQERRWHVTASLTMGFLTALVCVVVTNPIIRYIMLCFVMAGVWTSIPLVLAWLSETINIPAEKRAVCLALVNSVANLSSLYGSRIWPSDTAPNYIFGWSVTAGALGCAAVVVALIPVVLRFVEPYVTQAEKDLQDRRESVAAEPLFTEG